MQPEVRAVQVAIIIYAAYSRSSHACQCYHYIKSLLSTGSRSSCCSRGVYWLKMLLDRDTNNCFDKDITTYLGMYQNKRIYK